MVVKKLELNKKPPESEFFLIHFILFNHDATVRQSTTA